MTRPGNRPPSASEQQLAASLSGAVDLSGLKQRAEARRNAPAPGRAAPGGAGGPSTSGVVTFVEVDEASFEQEVLVRSTQVPVIVELMSRRAPTQMTGLLSALAEMSAGEWVHALVDVDVSPQIAQAFQAQAVPTVIAVAAGRPLADFEGEQQEDALRQWLAAVMQATEGKLSGPAQQAEEVDPEEAADPERDAAEEALSEGDLVTAEERFTALVESRPGDHSLVEALRYTQAGRRVSEDVDAGEGTVAAALRGADRVVVSGEYENAFSVLVDAIRVSAGDDRATLRTRLLELLEVLPADDPRVLAARRNLASALY